MKLTPTTFKPRLAWLALAATTLCVPFAQAAASEPTTRVIVAYKPGALGLIRAAVASARGNVAHEIFGMDAMAVELPAQAVAALARHAQVEFIEEDVKRYPFAATTPSTGAPYLSGQLVPYGINLVQADLLAGTDTNGRKICIIDSGYDRTHEDLSSSSTNVTGEFDSGTGWWYTDENHHGTHVAGTISALNNAGTGVVGVLENGTIKLHIVKVFGAAGWAYSSSLATAANKCKAAGANVISMSLGGSRSNKIEQRAFDSIYAGGILNIAAAGNAGTTAQSYPAGYSSVISVAAVDEAKAWATFSQYNSKVELSGPGVNVLSTVPMGTGSASALTVGTTVYAPGGMDGSPRLSRTGALADFGLGGATMPGMSGMVCLIQRGTYDFATKVSNCQSSGGVGAVVYNNVAGGFGGTLGGVVTTIPSVTASAAEGAAMLGQLGQDATVSVGASNYAFFDGTSMATPHVSAVAALVWSIRPECTAAKLRASLQKSAQDIGAAGKDNKTGYGLVQAKAAVDRIRDFGCGN